MGNKSVSKQQIIYIMGGRGELEGLIQLETISFLPEVATCVKPP